MYCYRCNHEIGAADVCPVCGTDLFYFQKARKISNAYYNDGLEKATVRSLSGAIVSLQKALKFDKENTNARNLLGLCYLEMGEVVNAIGEWVVSRHFCPENNRAEFYLGEIQANSAKLEIVNQTIKKYNQALLYCKQDSRDLAIIQLKKVLNLNPKFVKGYQLLGLLYLQEGRVEQAKKTLRNAAKIDTDNVTTLRYLKEANRRIREEGTGKKKDSDDLISYQSGNETIIMPKRIKESSLGATIIALVVGIAVGCAVTAALVVPDVKRRAVAQVKEQTLESNDALAQNTKQIEGLNAQIAELQSQLQQKESDEQANANRTAAYDNLLSAYVAFTGSDVLAAGNSLNLIDTQYLSESAAAIYNTLNEQVSARYIGQLYEEGYAKYSGGDFAAAITALQTVTAKDMNYEEGYAAYYLAQSLRKNGDSEGAKQYYQYVIDNYPNTERARTAKQYVE